MSVDYRLVTLDGYRPRTFRIECHRCRREAVLDKYDMIRRYGKTTTLADVAQKVAVKAGCNLAALPAGPGCSARLYETPVWTWARLRDARIGGWSVYLTCQRRFAALKSADSCPETFRLDVLTLIAALGDDYPLDRLQTKAQCPLCGTSSVELTWHVPEPPSTPAPIQERPPEPVRLRPQGAALARTRLGVVKG